MPTSQEVVETLYVPDPSRMKSVKDFFKTAKEKQKCGEKRKIVSSKGQACQEIIQIDDGDDDVRKSGAKRSKPSASNGCSKVIDVDKVCRKIIEINCDHNNEKDETSKFSTPNECSGVDEVNGVFQGRTAFQYDDVNVGDLLRNNSKHIDPKRSNSDKDSALKEIIVIPSKEDNFRQSGNNPEPTTADGFNNEESDGELIIEVNGESITIPTKLVNEEDINIDNSNVFLDVHPLDTNDCNYSFITPVEVKVDVPDIDKVNVPFEKILYATGTKQDLCLDIDPPKRIINNTIGTVSKEINSWPKNLCKCNNPTADDSEEYFYAALAKSANLIQRYRDRLSLRKEVTERVMSAVAKYFANAADED